ncbi:MAG: trypsin-like peptidase domain-containing protein [Lachnospiraceae bacterium]
MDNEYSYYVPNQPEPNNNPKKEKNKIKTPKMVKVIGFAVTFGVVACVTFQAGNLISNRILGIETGSKKVEKVENTKLTQATSAVSSKQSDIAEVAQSAMPSLVSITNMSIQQVQNFFGGVTPQESKSMGSGIIIGQNDTELLVATNNHVVAGSETLTVSFIDEESVEAQIKGTDATKDLAVVAVPVASIPSATMEKIKVATMGDSNKLNAGDTAIAIGNALGYGQSVTSGIISATNRTLEGYDLTLIQTDAAINPGNSGGALLNANGEVIGINSAKISAEQVEGVGYAIPISEASKDIDTLMNQKTRSKVSEEEKGYLGIKGVDVTAESAQMYNMPSGVYVSEAIKGGGAEAAGITKGEVITALDGSGIDSMTTLQNKLQYYKFGETVKLTIQSPKSGGEYSERTVEVKLEKNS